MLAASEKIAVAFSLSPGNEHDAAEGRKLLGELGKSLGKCSVIMDRAYEGDETRNLVKNLGYKPVVPPKANRINPWKYSKKQYKNRNEDSCKIGMFSKCSYYRNVFIGFWGGAFHRNLFILGYFYPFYPFLPLFPLIGRTSPEEPAKIRHA
jgi:transposase